MTQEEIDDKIDFEAWRDDTFIILDRELSLLQAWLASRRLLREQIKELETRLELRNNILCPECLQILEYDGSCLTCQFAKKVKELEEGIKKFKQQWNEEPDSYYQDFVDELFKLVEKE